MSFTVQFGNGGAATVADLTNVADQAAYGLLTNGISGNSTSGGQSVPVSSVDVAGGGRVGVSYDTAQNGFSFDVAGAWNSVKNVLIDSDSAQNISLKDFVHADVHLRGTGNSSVEILNVKRGNITTGDGNDNVHISLLSNDKGWVNDTVIETGAGDDRISITEGQSLKDIGGITKATAVNGGKGVLDGSNTSVVIDAGDGNDFIDLSAVALKSATIIGGEGIDRMIASKGADTFEFKLGDMTKSAFATDVIEGFDQRFDKIKVEGTTFSDWSVTSFDDSSILTYKGADAVHKGEKIVFNDVELSTTNHDWFHSGVVAV